MSAWKPTAGDQPMYDGPDLPAADLPEDHEGLEPTPLPVDVSKINIKVTGYDTPSQQRTGTVTQRRALSCDDGGLLFDQGPYSRTR